MKQTLFGVILLESYSSHLLKIIYYTMKKITMQWMFLIDIMKILIENGDVSTFSLSHYQVKMRVDI